jgi:hypothetical protein
MSGVDNMYRVFLLVSEITSRLWNDGSELLSRFLSPHPEALPVPSPSGYRIFPKKCWIVLTILGGCDPDISNNP